MTFNLKLTKVAIMFLGSNALIVHNNAATILTMSGRRALLLLLHYCCTTWLIQQPTLQSKCGVWKPHQAESPDQLRVSFCLTACFLWYRTRLASKPPIPNVPSSNAKLWKTINRKFRHFFFSSQVQGQAAWSVLGSQWSQSECVCVLKGGWNWRNCQY